MENDPVRLAWHVKWRMLDHGRIYLELLAKHIAMILKPNMPSNRTKSNK